jgi:hypothetical protein
MFFLALTLNHFTTKTKQIMETLFKKFKTGMIAFGAMTLMMVAGWQFGVSGTDEVFTDKEVALENAIAGSGEQWVCCKTTYTSYCTDKYGNGWSYSRKINDATTCTGHES